MYITSPCLNVQLSLFQSFSLLRHYLMHPILWLYKWSLKNYFLLFFGYAYPLLSSTTTISDIYTTSHQNLNYINLYSLIVNLNVLYLLSIMEKKETTIYYVYSLREVTYSLVAATSLTAPISSSNNFSYFSFSKIFLGSFFSFSSKFFPEE